MINRITWPWFILIVLMAGIVTGCNATQPPEVTRQAALPTPTLEPTFTRVPKPVFTIAPLPTIELPTSSSTNFETEDTPPLIDMDVGETSSTTGDSLPGGTQPSQSPQVALVLDISGSMNTLVLPDELPKDLAEIRAEIEQIENDPEYVRLSEELDIIYEDSRVVAAEQAWSEAREVRENWLFENGYSYDEFVLEENIATLLVNFGCDEDYGYSIAYASDLSEVDEGLRYACEGVALSDAQRQAVRDMMAYIEHPAYLALRQAEEEEEALYDETLNSLGHQEISEQLYNFEQSHNYYELQNEFEITAQELGIPTRLGLAKQATLTLLDLSRLDMVVSGRNSPVSLTAFSDNAKLLQPLTQDYGLLEAGVNRIDELDILFGGTDIGLGLDEALVELERNADLTQPAVIILLSDGYGYSAILDQIPSRAEELGIRICTVGFGNEESDVDVELMQNLAETTGGEYLFATTGEELVAFFVTCRQGLVSSIIDTFAGVIREGETVEAGRLNIRDDITELTLTLNYLQGNLVMELVDSEGNVIDAGYPGVSTQQRANVQLVNITNPRPGEWIVRVTANAAPEDGVLYNIVVGVELLPATPTPTPVPTLTVVPSPTAVSVPTLVPTPPAVATPTPEPSLWMQITPYLGVTFAIGIGLIAVIGGFVVIVISIPRSGK